MNIGFAYSQQDRFDIIHDHNSPVSLPAANLATTPVVMTIHSPLSETYQKLFRIHSRPNLVSISKAQLKGLTTRLNFVATVPNGLNFNHFPFNHTPKNFLLFVGRISHEKGVHNAIEVAQALDLPLLIAAKLDSVDRPYFEKHIRPKLADKRIRWIGEVSETERNKLYSQALAFLHPVTWPEPFGLTMIEAMACGCPVIAFDKGSVAEIVDHGKIGFVVKSLKEMIESVHRIVKINRTEIRDYAIRNFNAAKMADGYEAVYRQILSSQKTSSYPGEGLELLLGPGLSNRQDLRN
jgi:glycosyltransferase involved in cell wall biosynthesis